MRPSKFEIFFMSLGYVLGGIVFAFFLGITLLGFYTGALLLEGFRVTKKLILKWPTQESKLKKQ